MFKNFFNSSGNFFFKFSEFSIPILVILLIGYNIFVDVFKVSKTEEHIFIVLILFIYTLLVAVFTRLSIDVGFSSFSYILGKTKEKKHWLDRISKPKLICNVDGINIAFYIIDNHIDYAPVDVDNIDLPVWIKVDEKLSPLVKSIESIENLKSVLGCN